MVPLLAVATFGSLVSTAGNYMAAKASARALAQNAEIALFQADEIGERAKINIGATKKEGYREIGKQLQAFTSSGIDSSSQQALAVMQDSARTISENIVNIQRESDFEQMMKRKEAESLKQQAKDMKKASKFQLIGGVLGAGALGAR